MIRYEGIQQLARILGRSSIAQELGMPEGQLSQTLTSEQRQALQALADGHLDDIAKAILEEAVACDDVVDTVSASVYVEDRLSFLAGLLTDRQVQDIRTTLDKHITNWA